MSFVVDNSVTAARSIADEHTDELLELLRDAHMSALHVRALWSVEYANVLNLARVKNRFSDEGVAAAVGLMRTLDIRIEAPASLASLPSLLAIVETFRLTAYDAAYLDLARGKGLPLATLDRELRRACVVAAVPLLR